MSSRDSERTSFLMLVSFQELDGLTCFTSSGYVAIVEHCTPSSSNQTVITSNGMFLPRIFALDFLKTTVSMSTAMPAPFGR